ncbi:hypothetical protein K5D42_03095, partial [Pseudomonas cichorii]
IFSFKTVSWLIASLGLSVLKGLKCAIFCAFAQFLYWGSHVLFCGHLGSLFTALSTFCCAEFCA